MRARYVLGLRPWYWTKTFKSFAWKIVLKTPLGKSFLRSKLVAQYQGFPSLAESYEFYTAVVPSIYDKNHPPYTQNDWKYSLLWKLQAKKGPHW